MFAIQPTYKHRKGADMDLGKRIGTGILLLAIGLLLTAMVFPPKAFPGQPEGYIPSLDAKVLGLRFFESGRGLPKLENRRYADWFFKRSARFINWELNIAYPKATTTKKFQAKIKYLRPDGGLFSESTYKSGVIKVGWKNSFHASGKGWDKPGRWPLGTYRVLIYIDNRKVAEGSFRIVPPSPRPRDDDLKPPQRPAPKKKTQFPDDLGEL